MAVFSNLPVAAELQVVHKHYRLIRLTSPNLNYIIGAGATLLYLDICLKVVPTVDPDVVIIMCNVSY